MRRLAQRQNLAGAWLARVLSAFVCPMPAVVTWSSPAYVGIHTDHKLRPRRHLLSP